MVNTQYNITNSKFNNKSRYYAIGPSDSSPDDKKLKWWDMAGFNFKDQFEKTIVIENVYDKRPDLLSYDIYGTHQLSWVILMYNKIIDVNDFTVGSTIKHPSSQFVFGVILKNRHS